MDDPPPASAGGTKGPKRKRNDRGTRPQGGAAASLGMAATEVLAAALAALACATFGSLLRGFATAAAVKLLLRRGVRRAPAALALVALPAPFGCLILAELLASALRLAATSRRHPRALLGRLARAAAAAGDVDAALARLPSRALRPPSAATSAWAASPPLPRTKKGGEAGGAATDAAMAHAITLASALRRWLLIAAAASIAAPFVFQRWPAAILPRVAVAVWLLFCHPRRA